MLSLLVLPEWILVCPSQSTEFAGLVAVKTVAASRIWIVSLVLVRTVSDSFALGLPVEGPNRDEE